MIAQKSEYDRNFRWNDPVRISRANAPLTSFQQQQKTSHTNQQQPQQRTQQAPLKKAGKIKADSQNSNKKEPLFQSKRRVEHTEVSPAIRLALNHSTDADQKQPERHRLISNHKSAQLLSASDPEQPRSTFTDNKNGKLWADVVTPQHHERLDSHHHRHHHHNHHHHQDQHQHRNNHHDNQHRRKHRDRHYSRHHHHHRKYGSSRDYHKIGRPATQIAAPKLSSGVPTRSGSRMASNGVTRSLAVTALPKRQSEYQSEYSRDRDDVVLLRSYSGVAGAAGGRGSSGTEAAHQREQRRRRMVFESQMDVIGRAGAAVRRPISSEYGAEFSDKRQKKSGPAGAAEKPKEGGASQTDRVTETANKTCEPMRRHSFKVKPSRYRTEYAANFETTGRFMQHNHNMEKNGAEHGDEKRSETERPRHRQQRDEKSEQQLWLDELAALRRRVSENRMRNRGSHFSSRHSGQLIAAEQYFDAENTVVDAADDDDGDRDDADKFRSIRTDRKTIAGEDAELGRVPTCRMQKGEARHHLDRSTPNMGGAVLTNPSDRFKAAHHQSLWTAAELESPDVIGRSSAAAKAANPEEQRRLLRQSHSHKQQEQQRQPINTWQQLRHTVALPIAGQPTRDTHSLVSPHPLAAVASDQSNTRNASTTKVNRRQRRGRGHRYSSADSRSYSSSLSSSSARSVSRGSSISSYSSSRSSVSSSSSSAKPLSPTSSSEDSQLWVDDTTANLKKLRTNKKSQIKKGTHRQQKWAKTTRQQSQHTETETEMIEQARERLRQDKNKSTLSGSARISALARTAPAPTKERWRI